MENSGYSNSRYHLQELGDTQYKVAKGTPDIRGWEVVDVQNQYLGLVKELLYDSSAGKVRYVVLDLQENQAQLAPRQVLVPVGIAEVLGDTRIVVLSKVTTTQLATLPAYDKGHLNQEVETKVLRVFAGEPSIQIEQENSLPGFGTGENPLTAQKDNPPLYPKQIPFEKAFSEADLGSFEDGFIELRERIEVPTLHKKAFVVEEIVIGKEVEVHEETIYETVKKTEVDIDRFSSQTDGPESKSDTPF